MVSAEGVRTISKNKKEKERSFFSSSIQNELIQILCDTKDSEVHKLVLLFGK